jgi:hypothetical protein
MGEYSLMVDSPTFDERPTAQALQGNGGYPEHRAPVSTRGKD